MVMLNDQRLLVATKGTAILKYPKLIQSPGLFFEVKNISLDSYEDLISAEHVGSKHIKTAGRCRTCLCSRTRRPLCWLCAISLAKGNWSIWVYLSCWSLRLTAMVGEPMAMSWWLRPYLDCRQLGRLQVEENTQRDMCSMAAVDTWCLMILVHNGIKHDNSN